MAGLPRRLQRADQKHADRPLGRRRVRYWLRRRPGRSTPQRPTDIPPESRPEAEAATFNARLPMHLKKVLQRAADIRHETLTEFVLGSAYDRALTTILDDTVLRLSERDGEPFASALSEPGPIKEAVLARFRAVSESGRSGVRSSGL